MSSKVIDILNTLSFVSDYNTSGLTSTSNRLTVDSSGVLTLFNTSASIHSSIGGLILQNGGLSINTTVNATNVSSGGGLTIAGGAAISGNLIVGGSIIYSNPTIVRSSFGYLTLISTEQSTNISSGSLITFGGISIKTSVNATSITNGGSLTIAGGAAIKSDFYVGGISYLTDIISSNISTSTLITSNATINNAIFTNITSGIINVSGVTVQNINFTENLYRNGSLYVSSQWSTFDTNIFYTSGNVGINNTNPSYKLDVNGSLRINSDIINLIRSNTTNDTLQLQNTNASGSSSLQFLNNTGLNKGRFGFGNANSSILQNTLFLSTLSGTPINIIAGGNTQNPFILNASDNSVSITSTTVSIDTSSGSLKVSGGASIRGDLYIGGSLNVNSPFTVNINSSIVSSNSTTGAMKLIGGLSIAISDTTNSNATSYTTGGGITVKGGLAISQDTFIGGVLDIQSGSNNINPIKLQSLQIHSNYNNGTSTVIQSGNSSRTSTSFTPILFSGYNDQTNPKLSINASTIVTNNQVVMTNNSNTFGSIITTGGNVGINTTSPIFTLDISGTSRITEGLTTGNIFATNLISSNITTTNFIVTNSTISNLISTKSIINNITTTSIIITGGSLTATFNSNTLGNLYTTGGNIGINSTTPTSRLTIGGSGQTLLVSSGSTTQSIYQGFFTGNSQALIGIDGNGFGAFNTGAMLISSWTNHPLILGTNQTQRMFISTNGNIGINNTSPLFALDISGVLRTKSTTLSKLSNIGTLARFDTLDVSPLTLLIESIGSSIANLQTISIHAVELGVSDIRNIVLQPYGGNIGINTTNPIFTLDVSGTSRITEGLTTGNIFATNLISSNITTTNFIVTNSTISNLISTKSIINNITTTSIIITGGSLTATFNSNTLGNLYTTGGNIGINSTTPTSQLTIGGSGQTLLISSGSNTQSVYQGFFTGNSQALIGIDGAGFRGFNTGAMLISSWTNHPLILGTNQIPRMIISTAGNIGIGTGVNVFLNASSFDLFVLGTARITDGLSLPSGFIGNTALNSNKLYIRGNGDENHFIANGTTFPIAGYTSDGTIIAGNAGGALSYQSSGGQEGQFPRLVWNSNGVIVNGPLLVTGALSKASGTFDIPHPIVPNKRLIHSFVEGPRCDLIYRGTVTLQNGLGTVNIDLDCVHELECAMTIGTFESLCTNPVKYLHNNDSFDRVRGVINGNMLTIICENKGSNVKIDWLIIAERKDSFIKTWNRTNDSGYLVTEY